MNTIVGRLERMMLSSAGQGHAARIRDAVKDRRAEEHGSRKRTRRSHSDKHVSRKVKERVDSGVERCTLPDYSGEVSLAIDPAHIYGIVLPMGHGKTWLAEREGWIDWDKFVPDDVRARVMNRVYERLGAGESYQDAMTHMDELAIKGLSIMRSCNGALLLTSSSEFLERSGVKCVLKIVLNEPEFNKNISKREPYEQQAAMISRRAVLSESRYNDKLYVADTNEEVLDILYKACGALGLDVGCPKLINEDYTLPPGIGGRECCNLDDVIGYYHRGLASRALVDYQVKANGLNTYRGFGFTVNDWAGVAGMVVDSGGNCDGSEPMGEWPVTLAKLSAKYDMSSDEDANLIINAHRGDSEAFVTCLLLHWKMYGRLHDVCGHLLPLYLVRQHRWVKVMKQVREGVYGSNTFMDNYLTLDERELLLSMHALSANTAYSLKKMIREDPSGYPGQGPPEQLRRQVEAAGDSIALEVNWSDITAEKSVRRMMKQSNVLELGAIDSALDGLGILRRKDVIAYRFAYRAYQEWHGSKGGDVSVMVAMRHIAQKWYRISRLREEWFEFMSNVLDSEVSSDDKLAAMTVEVAIAQGLEAGLDWSNRTTDCLQHVLLISWLGYRLGKPVGLAVDNSNQVTPHVIGASEQESWEEVMRMGAPKVMLKWMRRTYNGLQVAGELIDWSQSTTGYIMELVHASRWLPGLDRRERIGLLINWLNREVAGCDEEFRREVLGLYARQWVKRRLTKQLGEELMILRTMSRRDGGYGLGNGRGRVELDKSNAWSGHRGSISCNRASTQPSSCTDYKFVDAAVSDPNSGKHVVTASALCCSGALVVAVMECTDKEVLNKACLAIENLRANRPNYLEKVLNWRVVVLTDAAADERRENEVRRQDINEARAAAGQPTVSNADFRAPSYQE
nr:hypothetical protein [Chrysovirus sp.]